MLQRCRRRRGPFVLWLCGGAFSYASGCSFGLWEVEGRRSEIFEVTFGLFDKQTEVAWQNIGEGGVHR